MRAVVAVLSLVLALASVPTARAQDTGSLDEIIVQVNGGVIVRSAYQAALSDLRDALKLEMEKQGKSDAEFEAEYEKQKPLVLDQMIEDLLLEQKARDLGLDLDVEAGVDRELLRMGKEHGIHDVRGVEDAMRINGVSVEHVRASIRKPLTRQAVLGREVAQPLMGRGATREEVDAAIKPYLKKLRDEAFIKFTNPSP